MWTDPIVAEIHRVRQAHAKKFGDDLRRMFNDLRRRQQESAREVVSLMRPRKPAFRAKQR